MWRSTRCWACKTWQIRKTRKCFLFVVLFLTAAAMFLIGFQVPSVVKTEWDQMNMVVANPFRERGQHAAVGDSGNYGDLSLSPIETREMKLVSQKESETIAGSSKETWVPISGQETNGLIFLQNFRRAVSQGLLSRKGVYRQQKGFLTIGIPSVPRQGITYLYTTLDSIINQTTPVEQTTVTIVVYLGSFVEKDQQEVVDQLTTRYNTYFRSGFLHVVRAQPELYPNLNILKRNYNDNFERIKWRSKQVCDFSYLMTYARNISEYFLLLEDDVTAAKNYIGAIKGFINSLKNEYWVTLSFSHLGYIGKLHRSSELDSISTYFMLFYYEEPVDFLMPNYEGNRHQPGTHLRKPTLFQHWGKNSSLSGIQKNLVDLFFESVATTSLVDNPPANLYTNIRVFQQHTIKDAYEGGRKFFWGISPRKGNFVSIVFHKPIRLFRVLIHSGSPRISDDFLRSGILEAAPADDKQEKSQASSACADHAYEKIGSVNDAVIDTGNATKRLLFFTKCLRLTITNDQKSWIILRGIHIFTQDIDTDSL